MRLNPNGSVDTTFNPGGAGITGNGYGVQRRRRDEHQPCWRMARVYIAGHFKAYDGVAAGCVARLNANGTLDKTFKRR